MLSLSFVFWLFVVLFALIGAMRGWARELLVGFAVVIALFLIEMLEEYIPFVRDSIVGDTRFWVRTGILAVLVFFGYQTPNFPRLAANGRFVRETLQDTLLGLFLGGINGYLVFGSIWFFLNDASYPFSVITPPTSADAAGEAALKLIAVLPPAWLGIPTIYFAVAISFVFLIVVFI